MDVNKRFIKACEDGNFGEARKLLLEGANPRTTSSGYDRFLRNSGLTALHFACLKGNLEFMKLLIEEYQCDPNCRTDYGKTPLHIACRGGNLDIVQCLLSDQRCDSQCVDEDRKTPLHYACEYGKLDIVQCLLSDQRCDPQLADKEGMTPLHYACQYGKLDIVQCLLSDQRCDPQLADKEGMTPLHYACQNLDIVQRLLSDQRCDPQRADKEGMTPLHYACKEGKLEIVQCLLSDQRCDPNCVDVDGRTPLHHACDWGRELGIVQCLLSDQRCDPNCVDKDGMTPLHYACKDGYLKIVQCLLSDQRCDPQCVDKDGMTLLHYACKGGHLEIVHRLLSDQRCDPQLADKDRMTPLHYACKGGNLEIVQRLLSDQRCDPNCADKSGMTPLHYACKGGHSEIVQRLLSDQRCDTLRADKFGRTPLHYACKGGHSEIVQRLLSDQRCDTQRADKFGRTPLHYACKYGKLEIVQCLLSDQRCDPQLADKDGETPLHYACKYRESDIVKFLLSEIQCDPNTTTKDGRTPLSFAYDSSTIRELLLHGANPRTVYEHTKCGERLHVPEHSRLPPESAVKMFVVGDIGAGKSSLTAALKKESKGLSRLTSRITQVSGVEQRTAGIIPHEITSRKLGRLILYDLAGHKEYYASHDALLRSNMTASSEAIVLLVADLARNDKEFQATLQFWVAFIDNQCSSTGTKPHIVVIGSHADSVSSKVRTDKKAIIDSLASTPAFASFRFTGFVAMDCRYSVSSSMNELRKCLAESCESLRDSSVISYRNHCFLIYLIDQFQNLPAVALGKVLSHIQQHSRQDRSELSLHRIMPNTPSDLHQSCEELNKKGHLLYLKNSENSEKSWLVLDKEALLTDVTGSVFAPDSFKQHHDLASSTGVVPLSKMATHFPKCDPNMLAHFLTHLEFCHEIRDSEVLNILAAEAPSSQDRYFFFPALIQIEAPSLVWETSDEFSYHCGWLLQCSQAEQFFLPRFLHVILLRLAFSFALSADTHEVSSDLPTLKRKCTVWKNGISWANRSGVEAVVEVVERKVTMMLRCLNGHEMECVLLRSAVIEKVIQAKEEFCPKVSVTESFIHPSDATQYPPKPVPELKLFSLAEVANTVVSAEPCIVGAHGPPLLPLEKLFYFEPYATLGEPILQELFDEQNNPKYKTEVKDEFLYRVADQVHKKKDRFIELFKLPSTFLYENLHQAPPGPTHALVRVFQLWRVRSEGTYHCLRRELDQFSVFAGRNPLVVSAHCQPTVVYASGD